MTMQPTPLVRITDRDMFWRWLIGFGAQLLLFAAAVLTAANGHWRAATFCGLAAWAAATVKRRLTSGLAAAPRWLVGVHVARPVCDIERTEAFYTGVLGMRRLYRTRYHNCRFLMLACGPHRFSFLERPASVRPPVWLSPRGENPSHLGLVVASRDDVYRLAGWLKRCGVAVQITDARHDEAASIDEYAVYFADPDGHQIEVYCE